MKFLESLASLFRTSMPLKRINFRCSLNMLFRGMQLSLFSFLLTSINLKQDWSACVCRHVWGVCAVLEKKYCGWKRASRLCAKASCFMDFHLIKPMRFFWLAFHDRITFQTHTFFSAPPPSFLSFLTRAVGREEGVGQLECRWGSPLFKRPHNLE